MSSCQAHGLGSINMVFPHSLLVRVGEMAGLKKIMSRFGHAKPVIESWDRLIAQRTFAV